MVVDFPVQDEREAFVLTEEGLATRLEIHDGKANVGEADAARDVDPTAVGTTMSHRPIHPVENLYRVRLFFPKSAEARYPAHETSPGRRPNIAMVGTLGAQVER